MKMQGDVLLPGVPPRECDEIAKNDYCGNSSYCYKLTADLKDEDDSAASMQVDDENNHVMSGGESLVNGGTITAEIATPSSLMLAPHQTSVTSFEEFWEMNNNINCEDENLHLEIDSRVQNGKSELSDEVEVLPREPMAIMSDEDDEEDGQTPTPSQYFSTESAQDMMRRRSSFDPDRDLPESWTRKYLSRLRPYCRSSPSSPPGDDPPPRDLDRSGSIEDFDNFISRADEESIRKHFVFDTPITSSVATFSTQLSKNHDTSSFDSDNDGDLDDQCSLVRKRHVEDLSGYCLQYEEKRQSDNKGRGHWSWDQRKEWAFDCGTGVRRRRKLPDLPKHARHSFRGD